MTKIDIVSGFLGAGKTTFIQKMLKEAFKGEQVVLIENEFGEIGIDGGFLKESGIEIKEMNSGCICCSLVGDFGTSLKEVIATYHPERILIEPSGVGKLSDVIKAVADIELENEEMKDVKLNTAVAVVDVSKAKMYIKNFGEFFINQVESAGTIILSRTQNVSEEKTAEVVALLKEHNPKATIITTPWDQIDGMLILNNMESGKSLEEELLEEFLGFQACIRLTLVLLVLQISLQQSIGKDIGLASHAPVFAATQQSPSYQFVQVVLIDQRLHAVTVDKSLEVTHVGVIAAGVDFDEQGQH